MKPMVITNQKSTTINSKSEQQKKKSTIDTQKLKRKEHSSVQSISRVQLSATP